jgi:predicted nucleic acid-binding protein
VTVVDTSVAVAAFASWHDRHEAALQAMATEARLVGQVALETYAVLTRLPPPHRSPAPLVVEFLTGSFTHPMLVLPGRDHARLLATCSQSGIAGGAVYDAVVAATAVHAGETLVTLDRRAMPTYQALGGRVILI